MGFAAFFHLAPPDEDELGAVPFGSGFEPGEPESQGAGTAGEAPHGGGEQLNPDTGLIEGLRTTINDLTGQVSSLAGQVGGLESQIGAEQAEAPEQPAPANPGGSYPIPAAQQEAIDKGVQPGPGGVVPYESPNVTVGHAHYASEHSMATKPIKKTVHR